MSGPLLGYERRNAQRLTNVFGFDKLTMVLAPNSKKKGWSTSTKAEDEPAEGASAEDQSTEVESTEERSAEG